MFAPKKYIKAKTQEQKHFFGNKDEIPKEAKLLDKDYKPLYSETQNDQPTEQKLGKKSLEITNLSDESLMEVGREPDYPEHKALGRLVLILTVALCGVFAVIAMVLRCKKGGPER